MRIERKMNQQNVENKLPSHFQDDGLPAFYPVSSAERRMYVMYQLDPGSLSYNMPVVLKIHGQVVSERFLEVFQQLIQRHEAFRTSFTLVEGEPMQQVDREVDFILPRFQVETKAELTDLFHRLVRPFHLEQAPLLRAYLVECGIENYLVMDMHHIISDGFSLAIMVREFEQLYAGHPLPELKVQYRDYRTWHKEFLQSEKLKREEDFWLATYAGEFPVMELPLDAPRGSERSYEAGVVLFRLDSKVVTALGKYSVTQRTTLYMTLFALFNLLLEKYTGQDDLVVGTPVAGRSNPAFFEVIGMFVNTLAIRTRLSPDESFTAYLQRIKANLMKVFANQNYPFEMLVERLGASQDISRNPLFDVFFSLQGGEDLRPSMDGLRFEPVFFESGVAKFDLSLDGTVFGGEIDFCLEYCKALFKREKMEQFARHFCTLLKQVLAAPEKKLAELEVLSPDERYQILHGFNEVTVNYSKTALFHQFFEQQAVRTPGRIALRYKENVMTYAELNAQTNQLARHLRTKGVGPEKIVALLLKPCMEQIVAMLAVLKAGGAYLPIDPVTPAGRVELILADSKPVLLLTVGEVPFPDVRHIDLSNPDIYAGDPENLPVSAGAENLAYVIYTSGSTGNPKGVMIEHRNLAAYASSFAHEFHFTADDAVIHLASYSFDASVDEIFHILFVGGSVVIVEKEEMLNLQQLVNIIEKNRVTVFSSTPLFLNELNKLAPISGVHTFLSGGDLLKPEYITNLVRYATVYNVYGPTETTVCATFHKCGGILPKRIPIGKPVANSRIYLLGKNGEPVPVGVEGEICISGAGVGRGYLNQPGLTAGKFLPDPFCRGLRMYRTGDAGRWLPDGTIEFVGRLDQQIKIRGFRIEPGEIEQKLIIYPGIQDAVVVARDDGTGQPYLCAYLVPADSRAEKERAGGEAMTPVQGCLSSTALKSYLSTVLPEYMIPLSYQLISEIPRTSTGKVDRKRLPDPEGIHGHEYIVPRTDTEERLAVIWGELLGVKPVGRTDNFFALGGHSLKATALLLRIFQDFQAELSLRQIFEATTLAELAGLIESAGKSRYRIIAPVEKRDYYPASSAQKRLFILQQYAGIQTTYNLPGMLFIEGPLDHRRFHMALQKLVQRHEAFRTSFEMKDGEIVQIIHPDLTLPIHYQEADEQQWQQMARELIQPFDLSAAPLARVGFFYSGERSCLVFDMHHIISDAVSLNIIIADFVTFYQGTELETLAIQYKDFAVWQNALFQTEDFRKQEQYWLECFKGDLPVLEMPADYVRPTVQTFEGARREFPLDLALVQKVQGMMQIQGATLYMTLLAVYNILLSRYSGQEDLIVGSPIAGRHEPGLEKILGMFANTLALRNLPDGNKTFLEFLEEVKENALKAYENQDYPFEMLVEKLDVRRNIARNPLFDTVFVLQNAGVGELSIPDITFRPVQVEHNVSRFDMTWTVEEGKEYFLCVEYCTRLFRQSTIEQMAGHYINILQEVAVNPYIRLNEIEMLSREEKKYLLAESRGREVNYPRGKTVQQLFEEQVTRTPERIALKFGETEMTYQELNAKANRLARVLRLKGVRPDRIAGMLLERSHDMLIAILAVIKAGGAYLPIDPEYPSERIQFMLDDSAANILITDQEKIPAAFTGEVLHLCDEGLYRVEVKKAGLSQVPPLLPVSPDLAPVQTDDLIEEFMVDEFFNDDDLEHILVSDDSNLEHVNRPQDLLYIIYTSGSTGKPKGVMIEHRNLVRLLFNDRFQFDFTADDVWTMFHSYCFDFSVWEMYGALLYGGKLVIVPKVTAQNPAEFVKLLRTEQVTVLNQTPTAFYKLQEEEMQTIARDLAVRCIIYGGEALKPQKLKGWNTKYPETRLINMYGITETTVHVTYKEITASEIDSGVSNIGKPIPTLTAAILNRDLHWVPTGVAGELCIGGEGLARGYLKRPALTAEKFISHPYVPGERLYRSGDLGRRLPDGEIEYLGRMDHQVKIRGFRIELGEIESRLLHHQAIREAVVFESKDAEGQSFLVAYLVTERELSVGELRDYLKMSLPDYMIPAYFIRLDQLPLTSNGKLDRRALPLPEAQGSGRAYVAPMTNTEARLALIWQEVLGVGQIGRDDDFFELGGHSLKATTLIQKVKKDLQVEIALKDIFKTPVLKELAQVADQMVRSDYTALELVEEREFYPVSAVQKRIYLYHQIHGANTVYNISDALLIEGDLDSEQFKFAVQNVIKRHEAFRTSFKKVHNEIVQVIAPAVDLRIDELEFPDQEIMTSAASPGLVPHIRRFIQPFDLSRAPLLRVGIGKFGANHLVVFDMHHIIADGTSMNILVKDFLKAYAGEELQPLRVQYKEFAIWQNRFLVSAKMREQERYWLSRFADGVPALEFPLDYDRPEELSTEGDTVRFSLEELTVRQLLRLAQENGGSLFMMLLAALHILLARYSGQEQIITGTPVAGRTHADLDEMIGMFVNTLALKTNPVGEKMFHDYFAEVKEITLQAYENQDYQVEMLIDTLGLHPVPNRTPLFDVILVLQNMGKKIETSQLTVQPIRLETKTAKYDLALYVVEEDGLQFTLDYRSRLFKRETVELFAERLVQVLAEIVDNPEQKISGFCSRAEMGVTEDLSGFMDDLDDEF